MPAISGRALVTVSADKNRDFDLAWRGETQKDNYHDILVTLQKAKKASHKRKLTNNGLVLLSKAMLLQ